MLILFDPIGPVLCLVTPPLGTRPGLVNPWRRCKTSLVFHKLRRRDGGRVRAVSWLFIAVTAGFLLPKLLGQDGGESQPGTAEEYLHRGEERAGKKDYNGAIADYNVALQ